MTEQSFTTTDLLAIWTAIKRELVNMEDFLSTLTAPQLAGFLLWDAQRNGERDPRYAAILTAHEAVKKAFEERKKTWRETLDLLLEAA